MASSALRGASRIEIASELENFLIEVEKSKDQVIPVIPITASYYRDKVSYFKEQLRKQRLYSNTTATLPINMSNDTSSQQSQQSQQQFLSGKKKLGGNQIPTVKLKSENDDNFDEKWSLYREYITLQKQIEEVQQDGDQNYIEMRRRIDLSQVFREHGEFSEAYLQLILVEKIAQSKAQDGDFDPKVELLHAKCLFLLSIVLKEKNKLDDAKEYIESAKERADYLMKNISPSFTYREQCTNFVMKSARLLLSEISLYSAEDLISQHLKNFQSLPLGQTLTINEESKIEKVLSEYLIPGLQNVKMSNASSQKVTVSNLEVFRNLCYYSAVCMMMLRENKISKQLLSVAESTSPTRSNDKKKAISSNDIYLEANIEIDRKVSKLAEEIKVAEERAKQLEQQRKSTVQNSKGILKQHKYHSDDSDDDDWGDFVPAQGAMTGLAKLILGENEEEEGEDNDPIADDIFPSKYRLFKSRSYKEEDDRLPQCILTDSLISSTSNTFNNKVEFKKWIQQLAPLTNNQYNQMTPVTMFGYTLNDRLQMNGDQLSKLFDKLTETDPFTSRWIKMYYELCTRLYNVSSMEMMVSQQQNDGSQQANLLQQKCAHMVLNYFQMLKEFKPSHSSMSGLFDTTSSDIIAKLSDISDKGVDKKAFLFTASMEIFSIGGRLFHPEQEEITFILSVLKEWFPSNIMYIQLCKLQATIRYHMRLFRYDFMMPMKEEITRVYDELIKLFDSIESVESSNSPRRRSTLDETQHETSQPATSNIRASARNNPGYYPEKYFSPSLPAVAAKVIVLIHKYHNFWLTSLRRGGADDEWSYMPELPRHKLLIEKERLGLLLKKYYPKLPLSHVKAEVAYTVGSFWLRQPKSKEDRQLAECVLFECLYLYYRLSLSVQSTGYSFMITNDGLKALKRFSEVLYANDKYEYSSVCYEVYVNNYKLLRGRHDYQFIDDLTSVTTKHDDYNHSVKYYHILYEKAKEEKKIPQIARLSSKLSNLYMEKGEVLKAEKIKLESIDYAKKFGTLVDYRTDLEIELGSLLLQGGKFEKCIAVLYSVAQEQANKRHIVYEILARAYLKKRWFAECEDSLTEIANVLVTFYIQLNHQQEMKILETVTKYYFKRCMFGNALECVNIALYRCSGTFPVLASLFKLKGKILKAICQYSTHMSFPCSINETSDEELHQIVTQIEQTPTHRNNLLDTVNENDNSFLFSKRPTYYCMAEFLQDCVDCFTKARGYYEACSNEIGEAKVSLLIADTLIDYLFVPVALLSKEPERYVCLKDQIEENIKRNKDPQQAQFKAIAPINYLDLSFVFNQYVEAAVESAVAASDVFLSMFSYITAAECRYLQGKISSSKSFWCECRDVLFTLFVDSDSHIVLSTGTPLGVLENLMAVVKRMVRLLFCFEPEFVNQHLGMFDVYYVLDIQYEQAAKRLPTFEAESEYVDKEQQHPLSIEYYNNYFYSNLDKLVGNNKQLIESDKQLLSKNKPFEILQRRTASSASYHSVSTPTSATTPGSIKKGSFSLKKSSSISSTSSLGSDKANSDGSTGSNSGMNTISHFLEVPLRNKTPSPDVLKPNVTQLKQKILERVFGCILTMKHDTKKYYNEVHDRLRVRNQQCMRRLYNLMNAIRESGLSISNHKKGKKGASTMNLLNESPSSPLFFRSPQPYSPSKNIERDRSMSFDNSTGGMLMMMDLLPGDVELMEMLIRTVNLQKGTKLKGTIQKTMNVHLVLERNIARYASITPDIACLEENCKIIQRLKILDQLVYVFYIDNVLIYYIPKEGKKVVVPFGGRDHALLDDKSIRNVIDLNPSDEALVHASSSAILTKRMGKEMNIDKLEISNKFMNWSMVSLNKDLAQVDDYLLAMITQSARDKKAKKFSFEEIVKCLSKVLDASSIFSYKPNVAKYEAFKNGLSDLGFSFKQFFSQKSGTLTGLVGRRRTPSTIPKLDQLPMCEDPIILLCNSFLNVIPWELLFETCVTRANAVQYIVNRTKKKRGAERKVAEFVSFFTEDDVKAIAPAEQERKEWIFEDIQCKLNLRRAKTAGRIHKDLQDIPFHIPIIKNGKKPTKSTYKKKYEHVRFIEMSSVVNSQHTTLSRIIAEKLDKNQYPIFLFTWSDLANFSEIIHYIFQSINDCSVLFMPEMEMKKGVKYLMMILEAYYGQLSTFPTTSTQDIKPHTGSGNKLTVPSEEIVNAVPLERRNLHKFLINATKALKDEYEIPTALFFPPSLYTKTSKSKKSAASSASFITDYSPRR